MPEQFSLDQVPWNGGHVDGNERTVATFAVVVKRACDQLLAGTGFAVDHDGQVGLHQPGQNPVDFLHRGRPADQRHAFADIIDFDRFLDLRLLKGTADDARQFLQIEGLGQIFISPLLRGLDRGHERVLRAHDKDWQFRTQLFHARQNVEDVFVRHDDIGNDEIAVAGTDPAPEGIGVGRQAYCVAGPGEGLVEHGADGCVIISDENGASRHGQSFLSVEDVP